MVTQENIRASNALIATTLPKGVVAIFVGATSGIGEYTLIQFAKQTAGLEPLVYFVGRSQEAGDRITKECEELCPDGKFIFISTDTSLLKNIDEVCQRLKKELTVEGKALNLLWLSPGTLIFKSKTVEELNLPVALVHYGRTRFVLNLLPLLKKAQHLRRVVTCFAGTKEGPINLNDIQGWNTAVTSIASVRGHATSLVTLTMERIAKQAPEVSFVHDFPGPVKSGIARGTTGILMGMVKLAAAVLGPFMFIPNEVSGERHLYLCTSSRYPAATTVGTATDNLEGVALPTDVKVANGSDGQIGSGVYTVDEVCESGNEAVIKTLQTLRDDGTSDKVWKDLEEQYMRITGKMSLT